MSFKKILLHFSLIFFITTFVNHIALAQNYIEQYSAIKNRVTALEAEIEEISEKCVQIKARIAIKNLNSNLKLLDKILKERGEEHFNKWTSARAIFHGMRLELDDIEQDCSISTEKEASTEKEPT